ncbi:IS110 family transposase [Hymenobacter lutimineralis]|uniref:IS110 family transposase n=1 Tax=Hymenobacter lutimineralis TaxID=2606448 RepID=A0A5D6V9S5_9BACT|nr:transposase [Hymenobacter lutimineralis]TYZ12633.1 IS110 family transposase [Hymenobacter lutimineralis]TYZ12702.1 IS110 family transposase [Hymenobacter lutimineralis]
MPIVASLTAPLKYVVGIDIAKDTFVACFGLIEPSQQLRFGKEATFDNTLAGFEALLAWAARQQATAAALWFVVEATGVYYEALAYFLADNEQALSVLLPNKVKHFAQSTEFKSKTDQLDARLLCRLGLERALPAWQPPTPALRQLRALARERQRLADQGGRLKTRCHAYQHSYQPDERTLQRLAAQQQLIAQQLKAVDQDLSALLDAEPELARKLAHLTSVPGIGLTTAIVVVAETTGFSLVENERQLTSYAGLDVVQRQSGLSAQATRISRRGNVRLRTALYLPAVSSLRYNPQQKAFYARLRARQPSGKPGVIAVMRKLLLLCYSLWKNDRPYDPLFHPAQLAEKEVAPAT